MPYIIVITVIVTFLYLAVKKINNSVYEKGRLHLSNIDASDFMNREAKSLISNSDKAIFHFLVNRPWRETNEWFQNTYSLADEPSESNDSAVEEFKGLVKEAMLGDVDEPLKLLMKLKGLPKEVRKLQPSEYAKWSKLNQNTLHSHSKLKIVRFISASSVTAARACLK